MTGIRTSPFAVLYGTSAPVTAAQLAALKRQGAVSDAPVPEPKESK